MLIKLSVIAAIVLLVAVAHGSFIVEPGPRVPPTKGL